VFRPPKALKGEKQTNFRGRRDVELTVRERCLTAAARTHRTN